MQTRPVFPWKVTYAKQKQPGAAELGKLLCEVIYYILLVTLTRKAHITLFEK